jgi:hypothetical protein
MDLRMSIAHLFCGNDLKWSKCGLQVGGVRLEIVESPSNAGLELRWVLARWAVSRDLVEGTHGCCCREIGEVRSREVRDVNFWRMDVRLIFRNWWVRKP